MYQFVDRGHKRQIGTRIIPCIEAVAVRVPMVTSLLSIYLPSPHDCRLCVRNSFIQSTRLYTLHTKSHMCQRGYAIRDVEYLQGSGRRDIFASCCLSEKYSCKGVLNLQKGSFGKVLEQLLTDVHFICMTYAPFLSRFAVYSGCQIGKMSGYF